MSRPFWVRESGVSEATRDDVLWHPRKGMTAYYAVPQVLEIREALEKITSERHANNVSLASLVARSHVPAESPLQEKRPEALQRSKPLTVL